MQRSAALRSARLVVGSSSRLLPPPMALLSRARTLPYAERRPDAPLLAACAPRGPPSPIPDPRVRRSPWDAVGARRDLCASPQPEPSPKIAALVDQIAALTLLEASELTDALKVRSMRPHTHAHTHTHAYLCAAAAAALVGRSLNHPSARARRLAGAPRHQQRDDDG